MQWSKRLHHAPPVDGVPQKGTALVHVAVLHARGVDPVNASRKNHACLSKRLWMETVPAVRYEPLFLQLPAYDTAQPARRQPGHHFAVRV